MANQYEEAALATAIKRALTADAVRHMTYAQIAELAGVELGPNGESPEDFFYVHVRNYVASALAANAEAVIKEKRRVALEASITLHTDLGGLAVYEDADGNFVIK